MNVFTVLAISGGVFLAGCASSGGMEHVAGSAPLAAHSEQCKAATQQEIEALFDRWNQSLQTGDPHKVVANYADPSILLPTVSNKPRLTPAEKEDYFEHFLEDGPSGKIDMQFVEIGCNTAVDAGLYTFTFAKTGAVVKARFTYTRSSSGGSPDVRNPSEVASRRERLRAYFHRVRSDGRRVPDRHRAGPHRHRHPEGGHHSG